MRKIITWIAGGLGNQLFQYAAARSLAYDLQVELVLDTSFFLKPRIRNYKLGAYNINARKISPIELIAIKKQKFLWMPKYFLLRLPVLQVDENTLADGMNQEFSTLYMRGYWQNEKYFKKFRSEIMRELSLKQEPPSKIKAMAKKMSEEQSVSIHIRRGDYLSDPIVNNIFGVLTMDYYKKAIDFMRDQVNNSAFYVFSDDIDWARQFFLPEIEKNFVCVEGNNRDIYELWLMTHCRHNIIANSSFSWWGAWAGNFPEKVVIAPEQWTNLPMKELSNIVPSHWIRVNNK